MKKLILTLFIMSGFVIGTQAQTTLGSCDFYANSIFSSVVAEIQINGVPASMSDVIQAYDSDGNCSGAATLLENGGMTFCNLPIYGEESTNPNGEGINSDGIFSLRLYISSTGEEVDMIDASSPQPPYSGWMNTNGDFLPDWTFADGAVLNFLASTSTGCSDPTACNDGSTEPCTYATDWYADTDGDGLGDANDVQSACTQPTGYVANSDDDCDGTLDCAGVCNGSSVEDECGVCDGPGAPTWYADTDNDGSGDANNSTTACTQPAGFVDNSDDPDDSNPNVPACASGVFDCAGVCDGTAVEDCAGVCGGTAVADDCGVCNGDNSTCTDCNGVVNGGAVTDECGVCDGSGAPTWYADNDNDLLGDPNNTLVACSQPDGYVSNGNDSNDNSGSMSSVPTMSQWGLIILFLLSMTFVLMTAVAGKTSLAGYGDSGFSMNHLRDLKNYPFDGAIFRKCIHLTLFVLACIMACAVFVYGSFNLTDIIGTIIAAPIFTYLTHLFVISNRD